MNIKKELGEKIKRLRKQKKYTQEHFAELIDISSRNVSNIEQGISFPKPETLEKIAQTLSVSASELFAGDYIKPKEELIAGIQNYINQIKNDKKQLEKVYKILKSLIED